MRTLIIGASTNEDRYSYKAIQELRKLNFDVCALGLNEGEIMDVKIRIQPLNFKNIHTVSIYLRPQNQFQYLNYLISCLLYTSPSPRDVEESRMPSSA